MLGTTITKTPKNTEIVEVTFAVPQEQVNLLRQMAIRYILENNKEEVAFKLIELSSTKLKEDIKIWR